MWWGHWGWDIRQGMGYQTGDGVLDMGTGFQTRNGVPDKGLAFQTRDGAPDKGWGSRHGVGFQIGDVVPDTCGVPDMG